MKASICMSTRNKNDCLANTLYSISVQKASFDIEVCIVDDHSDEDPWAIVKEFIPDARYLRLKEKAPGFQAPNLCMELASPDSNIIILQSCDVIHVNEFVVEELCRGVRPKSICFAEVANIEVASDAYQYFDNWSHNVLTHWSDLPLRISRQALHYWLFFLGAIMRKDLELLDYRANCCDAIMSPKMKALGFEAFVLTYIKGVHQKHKKILADCHIADKCKYYCDRTNQAKGIQPDPNFYKEAILIDSHKSLKAYERAIHHAKKQILFKM